MKPRHRWLALFALFCALVALFACFPNRFPGSANLMLKLRGKSTISDRLVEFGPAAQSRWAPFFQRAGLAYPPQKLLLVGFKTEKRLEIYADAAGSWKFIRAFPILGASGKIGPKLREGDLQVPEGFYKIESLNPNSAFHLALRVSYPNAFDRAQAQKDGRTELGSDIMIHGSNASIGCLAMGDEAAEDLFVLAGQTGIENIEVMLSPVDFRVSDVSQDVKRPNWVRDLYGELAESVRKLEK